MRKYNVFIGSSSENIAYAEAVQTSLYHIPDVLTQCWSQGVFNIGNYPMEDLFAALRIADFAVFILSPDDYLISRNEEYYTVRDNVLFELGMFMGFLGRERTFFIIPEFGDYQYKIPSDLFGLNCAKYNVTSIKQNIDATLGPACTQIKRKIISQINTPSLNLQIEKFGLFPEFDVHYNELFRESTEISTYFIHSRRWRENNLDN